VVVVARQPQQSVGIDPNVFRNSAGGFGMLSPQNLLPNVKSGDQRSH
jgi:hypothetical protein